MHAIERELIDATGYKPARKFANRQDYLGSVLNAVLKLKDDEFDSLSDDAAAWANSAVEAKNSKAEELPDFDEIDPDAEPDGEPESEDETLAELEAEGEMEELAETVAPKAKPKKDPKPKKVEASDEELPDVKMDKWGAMEGSKNALALGMFEKGATSKEIKDALGGTYYNILKRMAIKGHKIEKVGAVIKLTHSDDVAKKAATPKKKK